MQKPIVVSETGHMIYDDAGNPLFDIVFGLGDYINCPGCGIKLEKPKKGSLAICPECRRIFQYSIHD